MADEFDALNEIDEDGVAIPPVGADDEDEEDDDVVDTDEETM